MPPARTALSNAARSNGRTAAPASAPNIAAEITLPLDFASASMSNAITRFAAKSAAIETAPGSATPSPGVCFSATANARWVEAINVVRSGVTSPRIIERPASINSAASTTSTSPGAGINANTGAASFFAGAISM